MSKQELFILMSERDTQRSTDTSKEGFIYSFVAGQSVIPMTPATCHQSLSFSFLHPALLHLFNQRSVLYPSNQLSLPNPSNQRSVLHPTNQGLVLYPSNRRSGLYLANGRLVIHPYDKHFVYPIHDQFSLDTTAAATTTIIII